VKEGGRRKKEKGRRKKEEGRRKKEEGKILPISSLRPLRPLRFNNSDRYNAIIEINAR
jgi:hypothetical protein